MPCPKAPLVFDPRRLMLYVALLIVKQQLKRLKKVGAISPLTFLTRATLITVRKPKGTVHLLADYSTGLHALPETHQHPLPSSEDCLTK